MEKLLSFVLRSIVQKPKEVKIKKEVIGLAPAQDSAEGERLNFKVKVNPEDLKIVIGKKGKTIRAIRNLLRLRAIKDKAQVNFELLED